MNSRKGRYYKMARTTRFKDVLEKEKKENPFITSNESLKGAPENNKKDPSKVITENSSHKDPIKDPKKKTAVKSRKVTKTFVAEDDNKRSDALQEISNKDINEIAKSFGIKEVESQGKARTFYMDDETYEKLDALAEARRVSKSAALRDIINRYL